MEFVTFEIAKKLKEKGFNDNCHAYYEPLKHCLNLSRVFKTNSLAENYKCVTAPTISQVLKWLRKEHHLHFEVVGAAYGYNLIISDTPDKGGTDRYYSHANDDGPNYAGAWDDHDDCVLYGIEYTLNNLI